MTARLVAGVDGCKGGWLAALWGPAGADAAFVLCADIPQLLEATASAAMVAIDMPIGLPDRIGPAGRGCDQAARAVLGARQSSVFAVPARCAVYESDYRAACAAAFAASDPPRQVSKQCFHLFPKIRALDAVMTPALQRRIVEAHPEAAFWAMNGRAPLAHPKRVKSRAHGPGMTERRALLVAAGFPLAAIDAVMFRAREAGPDDVLDACACAVVAARALRGAAIRFPDHPETDGKGLKMEIWA